MTWPTVDERRSRLIRAATRLIAQHWPDADGCCRWCRVVNCRPITAATSYLEEVIDPWTAASEPPPGQATEILLGGAVQQSGETNQ